MHDINVKSLQTFNDTEFRITTYRPPNEGTRKVLETKLRAAKKHLTAMQKESASAEVASQAAADRMEALTAERNAAKSTLNNAAEAMAKGTSTLDDLAGVNARLAIINTAWPAMLEETREKRRTASDARNQARYAGTLVQQIEADMILLELKEAVSGLLKKNLEKSGDAGLLFLPVQTPTLSPADTDD